MDEIGPYIERVFVQTLYNYWYKYFFFEKTKESQVKRKIKADEKIT